MKSNFSHLRMILLCVLLSSCDHGMNSVPEPMPEPEPELVCEQAQEKLMPLEVGNYWVYQIWPFITPDTVIAEITRKVPVTIAGVTYEASALSPLYPVNGARPPLEWLYWNGPCGLYWLGGIAPNDTLLYKTLLYKYPVEVGESWKTVRISYVPDLGFYFLDTLTVSLLSKDETIATPAGDFNAYVYSYRKRPADDVAEEWNYYHFYIPELGRIAYITKAADAEARTIDRMYLISHGEK